MKSHQNMTYYILSGPVFHGDSGSEVRIPIFCLWHLIWPAFCISMVQMINSTIADVLTIITVITAVSTQSYMCSMWVKIVYINPQGIASDRNLLVTCPDLTIYRLFWETIMTNNIMQCIEYITFDGYSKSQNSLPQNSKYQ